MFQFRVYKTLNKKKRHRERKSAEEEDEDTKKKHQRNKQNGEHTIRPVALVGGVGVRSRRFCFIVVVVVKKIIIGVECVYYVVEEVSLFEECDKKRGEYVRR